MKAKLYTPEIEQALVGYTYQLGGFLTFKITLFEKYWIVYQEGLGFDGVRLMNGKKIEAAYPTIQKARQALQDVFDYYYLPLSRSEIRHWFKEKWLRREEEKDLLGSFKNALLLGDHKTARKFYKRFSNFTREAIPEKVIFQLELTNT
jgi:hypothetical protein